MVVRMPVCAFVCERERREREREGECVCEGESEGEGVGGGCVGVWVCGRGVVCAE